MTINLLNTASIICFGLAFWFLLSLLWVSFWIVERQKIIIWCNLSLLTLFSVLGCYLAFLGIN